MERSAAAKEAASNLLEGLGTILLFFIAPLLCALLFVLSAWSIWFWIAVAWFLFKQF